MLPPGPQEASPPLWGSLLLSGWQAGTGLCQWEVLVLWKRCPSARGSKGVNKVLSTATSLNLLGVGLVGGGGCAVCVCVCGGGGGLLVMVAAVAVAAAAAAWPGG